MCQIISYSLTIILPFSILLYYIKYGKVYSKKGVKNLI